MSAGTDRIPPMKVGAIDLAPPLALAPMAGMTDTAFRRLVKRQGGCGLVVSEMVSSEGLVRGIDRTLEYAEYTEEERPVSIQIFGGDPEKMAAAAQIVEGMGADVVDVNMGCPVPKIAKHNAGCSLMREPEHAAGVIARDGARGADPGDGEDARRLGRDGDQCAGSGEADGRRRRGGGRGARPHRGAVLLRQLRLGPHRPRRVGCADSRCSAAATASSRSRSSIACAAARRRGVLVGRGALRNPWIFAQAARHDGGPDAARGHGRGRGPLPARVHRSAAQRARRRGRRLPPRRAGSGRCGSASPRAGARSG